MHCPKTGGSWVYRALEMSGLSSGIIGQEHNHKHSEPWAFTVVRNPADWWVSLWRHHEDHRWPKYDGMHPLYRINRIGACTLDEWLGIASGEFSGFCGEVFEMFAANADVALSTESLSEQLVALSVQRGWGIALPAKRINTSRAPAKTSFKLSIFKKTEPLAFEIWNNAKP